MHLLFSLTGKPEPTIKWFRENRELTDQADFEISYKDGRVSLTIPEVFQEDAGQFTCTAKNVAGSATSSAELVIRGEPSFLYCYLDTSSEGFMLSEI
jgi:titin